MGRSAASIRITTAALIGAAVVMCATAVSAQDTQRGWAQFPDLYGSKKAADLSQAHLTQAEVIAWTQERVTDILTLDPAAVSTKIPGLRPLFTDAGWASYGRLLGQMDVVTRVRTQQQAMATIVSGEAAVISGNAQPSGHFLWQVRLPVMQSFADGSANPPSTKHLLTVSILRATAPTASSTGEQPQHADLRIDALELAPAAP